MRALSIPNRQLLCLLVRFGALGVTSVTVLVARIFLAEAHAVGTTAKPIQKAQKENPLSLTGCRFRRISRFPLSDVRAKEGVMSLSTAHVHRLIVSASLALVVMLSTASPRGLALYEMAAPLFRFASASDGTLLAADAATGGVDLRKQVGTLIPAPSGSVSTAPIKRAATSATTDGGQARSAGLYELAFVHDGQIFKVRSDGTGLVQLTSEGVNSEPAWAPDGSRIAFVQSSTP